MIRRFVCLVCVLLCASCSHVPYRVQGIATVGTWEAGEAYVPNAEMLLIHKADTLRTLTNEDGFFDFGEVAYKSYVLDGRHPECGVACTRALNRLRIKTDNRTPSVEFLFSRIDSARMKSVQSAHAEVGDSTTRWQGHYSVQEMKKINRKRLRPWVLVGYVADARTLDRYEYAWPHVLSDAKVYVKIGRDTLCVPTDQWGRFVVWDIRRSNCTVWATCDGYQTSRPWQVWCDQIRPIGRAGLRMVHQHRSIGLYPMQ